MQNSHNNISASVVIKKIKEWTAPTLFMAISYLIWSDVSEMKNDIKTLLSQASADKVRIEKVEADIVFLQNAVFNTNKHVISQTSPVDGTDTVHPDYAVYVLKEDENYEEIINKINKNAI